MVTGTCNLSSDIPSSSISNKGISSLLIRCLVVVNVRGNSVLVTDIIIISSGIALSSIPNKGISLVVRGLLVIVAKVGGVSTIGNFVVVTGTPTLSSDISLSSIAIKGISLESFEVIASGLKVVEMDATFVVDELPKVSPSKCSVEGFIVEPIPLITSTGTSTFTVPFNFANKESAKLASVIVEIGIEIVSAESEVEVLNVEVDKSVEVERCSSCFVMSSGGFLVVTSSTGGICLEAIVVELIKSTMPTSGILGSPLSSIPLMYSGGTLVMEATISSSITSSS